MGDIPYAIGGSESKIFTPFGPSRDPKNDLGSKKKLEGAVVPCGKVACADQPSLECFGDSFRRSKIKYRRSRTRREKFRFRKSESPNCAWYSSICVTTKKSEGN